jgi:hypothetical protein
LKSSRRIFGIELIIQIRTLIPIEIDLLVAKEDLIGDRIGDRIIDLKIGDRIIDLKIGDRIIDLKIVNVVGLIHEGQHDRMIDRHLKGADHLNDQMEIDVAHLNDHQDQMEIDLLNEESLKDLYSELMILIILITTLELPKILKREIIIHEDVHLDLHDQRIEDQRIRNQEDQRIGDQLEIEHLN